MNTSIYSGGTSVEKVRKSVVEVSKTPPDAVKSLQKWKQVLKGEELSSRAYKRIIEEAIQVVEGLQQVKVSPPISSKTGRENENFTIAKILQEIKTIKATISQTQSSATSKSQSWASVASKPEVPGSIIRIQDEDEKKEISKLSSEELVNKIGRKEIIGARQMVNGQVKVYYAEAVTKQIMEKQKDWTQNLATTAQVASDYYQVLIHGMPFSFQPENPDHIKELQNANDAHTPGIKIQRAVWLKKTKETEKTAGSMIVWFEKAEHADTAITKGIMWKYELKTTEIFRSGFRTTQCFNCQRFGHIAKSCTVGSKCGQCAGAHNTKECKGKHDARCSNCGRNHTAWDVRCPTKLAARARAVQNRVQDAGKYLNGREQQKNGDSEWQTVGNKKRRTETTPYNPVIFTGTIAPPRGPGRPRKNPIPTTVATSTNLTPVTVTSRPTAARQAETPVSQPDIVEIVQSLAPQVEMSS